MHPLRVLGSNSMRAYSPVRTFSPFFVAIVNGPTSSSLLAGKAGEQAYSGLGVA
jgi:hypothetical protein